MRFHRYDRRTTTFDLPTAEVAVMFCASDWADMPWPVDAKLRAFLTNPVGPVNAGWTDQHAFDRLVDAVLTRRLARRGGR